MRVRAQDPVTGDMTFGRGSLNYLVNSPAAVAQLCLTRLLLFTGEWFLDKTEGTPWIGQIVGHRTQLTRDIAIKTRIFGTPGVVDITNYSSVVTDRGLSVECLITTLYGQTSLSIVL
jgi:hypothetical protein